MMSGFLQNKKMHVRYVVLGIMVIVLVYIPFTMLLALRVRYTETSQDDTSLKTLQRSLKEPLHKAIKVGINSNKTDKGLLMQLHDINLEPDGTVDLTLNLNVNELIKLVVAYTDGSFDGEMTRNKLPPSISYLISNSGICETAPNLLALIYVHSAPSHAKLRELLRNTWANTELFADGRTRVVFLLGRPQTSIEMDKLLGEHERYRDLVIGDFNDAYHNLTLKAVMGLKWVTTFCPDVKYVIKADDDAFVNIFEIFNMLDRYHSSRMIMCALWKENTMPIMRDPMKCKKWCVHFYEFPGRTHFPQYCAGITAVMSGPVVKDMYQASIKTPLFWIDDVYLTGVLAPKVTGIRYVNVMTNFTLKADLAYNDYMDNSRKPFTYIITQIKREDWFREMWNKTLNRLQPSQIKQLGRKVLDSNPGLKRKLLR